MILVVGDAMTDVYWFGDVARISPEAPVPVVRVLKEEQRLGAADNVCANIRAMGHQALSCTWTTSKKIRLVARNQQVARIDFDTEPTDQQVCALEQSFKNALQDCQIVIFSDYAKGCLKNVKSLIAIAKAEGKTVLVDPKGHDYTRYSGADLIKPNVNELKEMFGGWSSENELRLKVALLMKEANIGAVLLTRGAEGMTLYRPGIADSVPSIAREVYDVTGAGDTAIAAFAAALERGHDWMKAMECANKAAGIVCGKFGTAVATKEEVFGN